MFDINSGEVLVLAVLAVVVLGPERLPAYAERLREWVKQVRIILTSARGQMQEQLGPDFDSIDLQKLNPRQYDPRLIVREALLGDSDSAAGILKDLDPHQYDLRSVVQDALRDGGDVLKDLDLGEHDPQNEDSLHDADACDRPKDDGGQELRVREGTPPPGAEDAHTSHDDDYEIDEIDWQRFEEAKELEPSRVDNAPPDADLDSVDWLKFDGDEATATSDDESEPPQEAGSAASSPGPHLEPQSALPNSSSL